jgi:Predicted integral membrane protein (DUF2269)
MNHSEKRGLNRSTRNAALTIHLAAALGLFGASFVLVVAGLHAATLDDRARADAVYSLLRLLTVSIDIPLAIVTLLSGLTLALTSNWGILRDRWLTGKLVLYVATVAIGVALIAPTIDTMRDIVAVESPATSGTRWRLPAFAGVQMTMLLSAAALGVYKPSRAPQRRALATPR